MREETWGWLISSIIIGIVFSVPLGLTIFYITPNIQNPAINFCMAYTSSKGYEYDYTYHQFGFLWLSKEGTVTCHWKTTKETFDGGKVVEGHKKTFEISVEDLAEWKERAWGDYNVPIL